MFSGGGNEAVPVIKLFFFFFFKFSLGFPKPVLSVKNVDG